MVTKISKGVWFFSLLGTLGIFLYVYAALPDPIVFAVHETEVVVSRNGIFYSMLAVLALLNALVFVTATVFGRRDEYFVAWMYGLVTIFNLFFIVALELVNVSNSQERFDYGSIGYVIYTSIALVLIWSALWPIYRLLQRFSSKQTL